MKTTINPKPTDYCKVGVYRVSLVRDSVITSEGKEYGLTSKIGSPADAARVIAPMFDNLDREHFVELMLDVKNQIIGINVVSVGCLTSSVVHPREVFKAAIIANAHGIIVAHNHPSGDLTPSEDDIVTTKRLQECGTLLGIKLVDHLIFNESGEHVSLREKGHLE